MAVQKHPTGGLVVDQGAEHGTKLRCVSPILRVVANSVVAYLLSMAKKKDDNPNYKVIAENRRARYDYAIEDDIECGIVLTGSEVKSLRTGQSNITDSYASVDDGELWLTNAYIAPYKQAMFPHEERRKRKLLVNRRELARLWNATQRQGMTLVPLVLYFNHKGRVKIKIATAKGKQKQDKRATEAKRDWGRQKARLLREG
jgi:SsrA-binding protein